MIVHAQQTGFEIDGVFTRLQPQQAEILDKLLKAKGGFVTDKMLLNRSPEHVKVQVCKVRSILRDVRAPCVIIRCHSEGYRLICN